MLYGEVQLQDTVIADSYAGYKATGGQNMMSNLLGMLACGLYYIEWHL